MLFRFFFFPLFFIFGCSSFFSSSSPPPNFVLPHTSSEPSSPSSDRFSSFPCFSPPGKHIFFSVSIDGVDVGREIRTSFKEEGPFGDEILYLSHFFKRMKSGSVHFDSRTAISQRTLLSSGMLLRASHVSLDHVSANTYLVSYNGDVWERFSEIRSSVSDPLSSSPRPLSLSGKEIIGFRLSDFLRDVSLGKIDAPIFSSYYDSLLSSPSLIVIDKPFSSTISFDGQDIDGFWVESRLIEDDKVVVRCFFDLNGFLWIEEYPFLHEVRRRSLDPPSFSSNSSELLVGLRSESYLADPISAKRATYRLVSSADKLDSLSLLSDAYNQTVIRKSSDTLLLTVLSGSPDGRQLPSKSDLSSSSYINPDSSYIRKALLFLTSAGKKGHLEPDRKNNATSVIARASLIRNPRRFWSDPDKSAGLIMHFVNSILPDKRHTFSMSNDISTLKNGAGDCTEHSVLFASFMRAHGIPTRLVSGMILTRGGKWAFHMWNSYWNGSSWQSIDSSTMTYRTGALHVALGRGVARFSDVRNRLSDFMWRTFSGVSFDLIEASREGEILYLVQSRFSNSNPDETSLFNAVVLSERGDYDSAISLITSSFPTDRRSLDINLMLVELFFRSGRYKDSLEQILLLRNDTSSPKNSSFLDLYYFKCLLKLNRYNEAEIAFHRLEPLYDKGGVDHTLLLAEFLFGIGSEIESISLLERTLSLHPDNISLLSTFSDYVSTSSSSNSDLLLKAYNSSLLSAKLTMYSDYSSLSSLAKILLRLNKPFLSSWYLDHALLLAPSEPSLLSFRDKLPSLGICKESNTVSFFSFSNYL